MYLKIFNNNYSFRYKIPIKLRQHFDGRHELIVSLKTKDAKLAQSKAMRLGADLKIFIERIRWMISMQIDNIDELVSNWLSEKLERDFQARLRKSSLEGLSYEELPAQKQEDYTRQILEEISNDMRHLKLGNVANIANEILHGQLDVTSDSHKELMFKLLQAHVTLFDELHNRNQGKYNFEIMKRNNPLNDRQRLTYGEAIELYLRFLKDQISAKEFPRISQFLKTEFLIVFGKDNLIADYYDDVIEQLDDLSQLPKGSAYLIRNHGYSKDDFAVESTDDKISLATYKKYIMWTKGFFVWAYESRKLTETNVARSFKKISVEKASMQRSLLTDSEVLQLLNLAQKEDNDLYVMLKILAYTGMRHSEFFKMTIADNSFSLMDAKIELKTDSSYRNIPRHRALNDIEDATIHKLQKTYTPQMLSKMGMQLMRKIIEDPTKVVYSLRHSLINKLYNARVESNVVNNIVGHEVGSSMSAKRYFKGYELSILDEAINRVSYEDV